MRIRLVVNDREVTLETEPTRRLLDVLREDLRLTGVKEGCGEGECGACMVLLDHRAANACLVPVGCTDGSVIQTIEGYRSTDRYRLMEEAFAEAGAVQCGFCAPGFMMAAEALLRENSAPDEKEIRGALSGNLCRCTGYNACVEGVMMAAAKGKGLW